MKRLVLLALMALGFAGCNTDPFHESGIHHTPQSLLPSSHPDYQTTFVDSYDGGTPEEDELEGVQCPIPWKDRVFNHAGGQCVFSSIEMLGRWAEYKVLVEPPLTSRPNCQGGSGPSDAGGKLRALGVNFEQESNDKEAAMRLLKKAMAEGRGCLFDVPGHAMVLIHYDEEADVVKWVNNSDRSLKVNTSDVATWKKRWGGWILVVYAPEDVIPYKVNSLANQIPIIDHNSQQGEYPKNYIPIPKKDE